MEIKFEQNSYWSETVYMGKVGYENEISNEKEEYSFWVYHYKETFPLAKPEENEERWRLEWHLKTKFIPKDLRAKEDQIIEQFKNKQNNFK